MTCSDSYSYACLLLPHFVGAGAGVGLRVGCSHQAKTCPAAATPLLGPRIRTRVRGRDKVRVTSCNQGEGRFTGRVRVGVRLRRVCWLTNHVTAEIGDVKASTILRLETELGLDLLPCSDGLPYEGVKDLRLGLGLVMVWVRFVVMVRASIGVQTRILTT